MDRQYDGALFLADVTEKIKTRLEEIDRSLAEGQQEIEKHARVLLGELYGDGPVWVRGLR